MAHETADSQGRKREMKIVNGRPVPVEKDDDAEDAED